MLAWSLVAATFAALTQPPPAATANRRQVVAGAASLLGAEGAWQHAVRVATASDEAPLLPAGTVEEIEAGRVVVLKNWLPADELQALRADAERSFAAGHFKADALASYGQKKKAGTAGGFDPSNDRMVMPSFFPSKGTDGPWVDPSIGDHAARAAFKQRMARVKALLARQLEDRPTLALDTRQTHEMSYTRYGPGASLPRHTDEHHAELKKAHPVASGDENIKRLDAATAGPVGPKGTRRSVTWLVYLNDEWDAARDGGQLRVHERNAPICRSAGSRRPQMTPSCPSSSTRAARAPPTAASTLAPPTAPSATSRPSPLPRAPPSTSRGATFSRGSC